MSYFVQQGNQTIDLKDVIYSGTDVSDNAQGFSSFPGTMYNVLTNYETDTSFNFLYKPGNSPAIDLARNRIASYTDVNSSTQNIPIDSKYKYFSIYIQAAGGGGGGGGGGQYNNNNTHSSGASGGGGGGGGGAMFISRVPTNIYYSNNITINLGNGGTGGTGGNNNSNAGLGNKGNNGNQGNVTNVVFSPVFNLTFNGGGGGLAGNPASDDNPQYGNTIISGGAGGSSPNYSYNGSIPATIYQLSGTLAQQGPGGRGLTVNRSNLGYSVYEPQSTTQNGTNYNTNDSSGNGFTLTNFNLSTYININNTPLNLYIGGNGGYGVSENNISNNFQGFTGNNGNNARARVYFFIN